MPSSNLNLQATVEDLLHKNFESYFIEEKKNIARMIKLEIKNLNESKMNNVDYIIFFAFYQLVEAVSEKMNHDLSKHFLMIIQKYNPKLSKIQVNQISEEIPNIIEDLISEKSIAKKIDILFLNLFSQLKNEPVFCSKLAQFLNRFIENNLTFTLEHMDDSFKLSQYIKQGYTDNYRNIDIGQDPHQTPSSSASIKDREHFVLPSEYPETFEIKLTPTGSVLGKTKTISREIPTQYRTDCQLRLVDSHIWLATQDLPSDVILMTAKVNRAGNIYLTYKIMVGETRRTGYLTDAMLALPHGAIKTLINYDKFNNHESQFHLLETCRHQVMKAIIQQLSQPTISSSSSTLPIAQDNTYGFELHLIAAQAYLYKQVQCIQYKNLPNQEILIKQMTEKFFDLQSAFYNLIDEIHILNKKQQIKFNKLIYNLEKRKDAILMEINYYENHYEKLDQKQKIYAVELNKIYNGIVSINQIKLGAFINKSKKILHASKKSLPNNYQELMASYFEAINEIVALSTKETAISPNRSSSTDVLTLSDTAVVTVLPVASNVACDNSESGVSLDRENQDSQTACSSSPESLTTAPSVDMITASARSQEGKSPIYSQHQRSHLFHSSASLRELPGADEVLAIALSS